MEQPRIETKNVETLFESRFVKVFDLQYAPGKHYYNASRRGKEALCAVKSDEALRASLPDAVSCVVILETAGEEPRLLLSYEYRYPAGRFLLSVPAGLIDPEDAAEKEPVFTAAKREILEETGLTFGAGDEMRMISPFAFSTPGMTDESNAIVLVRLRDPDLSVLNQSGAVGSELFDGFCLLTRQQVREILNRGTDPRGNYFSVYTLIALTVFLAEPV
ncbi:MAG: NUDIX hydrolase [Lachnospiraceae bacterium]|nr:NUDIX hydrolase [Lachnospiraceae bacterium]